MSVPFTSGNSFLPKQDFTLTDDYSIVSIPFTSGNSFLRIDTDDEEMMHKGVNPLHTGELISTIRDGTKKMVTFNVLIPFTPGNSFLRKTCQVKMRENIVSIPFTSGNSFLREKGMYDSICWSACQSPSPRGTHFYNRLWFWMPVSKMCQSPSPRGTHFYSIYKVVNWLE